MQICALVNIVEEYNLWQAWPIDPTFEVIRIDLNRFKLMWKSAKLILLCLFSMSRWISCLRLISRSHMPKYDNLPWLEHSSLVFMSKCTLLGVLSL
jgi:hypothetical protein